MSKNKKKLLIIEAHSDDSSISCGGLLLKFSSDYEYHFCLISVSDITLYHYGTVTREQRMKEYQAYVTALNGVWHKNKTLPFDADAKLDTLPKKILVSEIEKVIEKVQPYTLIIQGPSFHHDHTLVYEACVAATRPTARYFPSEIYIMENPTYVHSLGPSTDFKPDMYVGLTENLLQKKLDLFVNCFPSQVREDKNYLSRSGIAAWARYRGIESRELYSEAYKIFFKKM